MRESVVTMQVLPTVESQVPSYRQYENLFDSVPLVQSNRVENYLNADMAAVNSIGNGSPDEHYHTMVAEHRNDNIAIEENLEHNPILSASPDLVRVRDSHNKRFDLKSHDDGESKSFEPDESRNDQGVYFNTLQYQRKSELPPIQHVITHANSTHKSQELNINDMHENTLSDQASSKITQLRISHDIMMEKKI